MGFIRINIATATEDCDVPPQELVELVVARMRKWLQDQGLEGALEYIDLNGVQTPSLKVEKPAHWGREDMQSFAAQAGRQLNKILDQADVDPEGDDEESADLSSN